MKFGCSDVRKVQECKKSVVLLHLNIADAHPIKCMNSLSSEVAALSCNNYRHCISPLLWYKTCKVARLFLMLCSFCICLWCAE